MTPAALIADLAVRGVELQAHGDKLRFRPAERVSSAEMETIRQHKAVILKLLRAEGIEPLNPAADPRPLAICDRCETTDYIETAIHDGQSLRRDCARCHRFLGWPRWYGRSIDDRN